MQLRSLGNTGLRVTPIGLGLAALGRPGYINLGHAQDLQTNYDRQAMQQHAHAVLDAAWAAGVRYFDAARSYGQAEAFLASWLASRSIAVQDVTVGSKWGYVYTADWQVEAEKHEVKEHSLANLQRQTKESRALLGDYLNLYQIHSATLDSGVLVNQDVLRELARMRDAGLVIGLSLSGIEQAQTLYRAMEIVIDDKPLFSCVQATWNLLERSAEDVLLEAHQRGMGVIIKEALANGRLTARNDAPEFKSQRALLEEVARSHSTTIDALALAAVMAQPWVDVALSGAATIEHLHSNLAALQVEWNSNLDDQLRVLIEPPDMYWATRSRLAWN